MRLWHKDLIAVLPRDLLVRQWRDCIYTAENIYLKSVPDYILTNIVVNYPASHLNRYARTVYDLTQQYGFRCDWEDYTRWVFNANYDVPIDEIFDGWMNERYLTQCFYRLQERYDRGVITEEDWERIEKVYY